MGARVPILDEINSRRLLGLYLGIRASNGGSLANTRAIYWHSGNQNQLGRCDGENFYGFLKAGMGHGHYISFIKDKGLIVGHYIKGSFDCEDGTRPIWW